MLRILTESREQRGCSGEALARALSGYQREKEDCADQLIRCVTALLIRVFAGPFTAVEPVEDLAHGTWLRIHRTRGSYRLGESPLPRILSIARHTRVDLYRRRLRATSGGRPLEAAALERHRVTSAEAEAVVDQPLALLPDSQPEALLMRKVFGTSVDEVARATSSAPSAVKQKAHRTYRTIRQSLSSGRNGSRM